MKNIVGNLGLIKKINRSLVLEKIKTSQPITRAQIARELTLSKTTVSAIVDELLERKLVIELGEEKNSKGGGRPGLMLGFNPKSAYGIGVDIGGTKILVIITDLIGNIVFTKKIKTTNKVENIAALVRDSIKEANITEKDVIGMGIGVPGTVKGGTVIRAKSLNWTKYDFQSAIEPYFPFPIFINNDVNFAAMGERWLGSGENSDNIFFVAIGTGIGSTIICDGNLIYGHQYRAGEICYQISRDDVKHKRFNRLGEMGVFEEKVSGTALNRFNCSSEEIFKLYSKGSQEAIQIITDFITELSVVIANVVSLLNPEYVIIGGGVSESMGVIVNEIQNMVDNLTPIKTHVKLATLGGKAGALGAIAYTFEQVKLN